jgi:hypothetical protein
MITITLSQSDLEEALLKYIQDLGVSIHGADVSVDLTAGRGANGFSASINLDFPKKVDIPVIPMVGKKILSNMEAMVKEMDEPKTTVIPDAEPLPAQQQGGCYKSL